MTNPLRILIVDDVPVIRKLISTTLENKDMTIVGTARNGKEAIDVAASQDIDIILLDIVMPIMQGYEVLPILRATYPETAIIMLTSTSERSLVLDCREKGANGYIIKDDHMIATLYDRVMVFWTKFINKQTENG